MSPRVLLQNCKVPVVLYGELLCNNGLPGFGHDVRLPIQKEKLQTDGLGALLFWDRRWALETRLAKCSAI